MLLLALIASLSYSAAATCPHDFELVRNGECHRKMYDGHDTYAATGAAMSIKNCEDYNAGSVNIKNQEDHDYWVSVAKTDRQNNRHFGNIILGIYCDTTNHWMWSDGRQVANEWKPNGIDADLLKPCFVDGQYCMWTVNPVTSNWQKYCNGWYATAEYCIIVPSTSVPESDPDCDNFDHEGDDDICYQIGKTASNYTEASTVCRSFGASVASIHNERENNFVRRLAVSKGLVNEVMLGGSSSSSKNTFTWADGTKWDYDNFGPGFPQNGFGDCVAMATNSVQGQWINVECDSNQPYVCIRRPDYGKPACDGAPRKEGDIIYSPGFPSDSSIPCDFMLTVSPGMLVEVEILLLEANSCCDRLVLSEEGAEIADLSGELYNGRTFRTTSQNTMKVSWQPEGGVNVRGMMIIFRAVSK